MTQNYWKSWLERQVTRLIYQGDERQDEEGKSQLRVMLHRNRSSPMSCQGQNWSGSATEAKGSVSGSKKLKEALVKQGYCK
jgi:hypothetical protein